MEAEDTDLVPTARTSTQPWVSPTVGSAFCHSTGPMARQWPRDELPFSLSYFHLKAVKVLAVLASWLHMLVVPGLLPGPPPSSTACGRGSSTLSGYLRPLTALPGAGPASAPVL